MWEDSNHEYEIQDGFSTHERKRGLRPRQDCEGIDQELGRSTFCSGNKLRGGVNQAQSNRIVPNKLQKQQERNEWDVEVRTVRSKGKCG